MADGLTACHADWIAIFFACVGGAGLICLSIFDAFNHSTVHWSCTLIFIIGVALSAIFQSAEIVRPPITVWASANSE